MLFARPLAVALVLASAVVTPRAHACSACGCTLSSDWASQGLAATGGWRADFRFDYFNQDQLRSGTDSVPRDSLTIPNEREVQQYTINRNYGLNLDYSPNKDWGVNFQLPWYDRAHATIAAGDTEVSTSHDTGIGDLRIVGRYMGLGEQRNTGIEFGIKLPSGRFTSDFRTGPQQGEPLDRGLQLGTGTTDLLVGAYNFGALAPDWGYFATAMLSQPLNSREHFRPGTGVNFNVGVRYTASETFVPQLQVDARIEKRESGANADVENSGASLVYLSPGVTWSITRRFSAYAFVQVPLYQRVNGLQIEATHTASVGMHYIF
ncbi:MAG TPA: hypothetical protein VLB69_09090 [Rudaea sp.]|nr:hypothetical protein [Rudaea sp.]